MKHSPSVDSLDYDSDVGQHAVVPYNNRNGHDRFFKTLTRRKVKVTLTPFFSRDSSATSSPTKVRKSVAFSGVPDFERQRLQQRSITYEQTGGEEDLTRAMVPAKQA